MVTNIDFIKSAIDNINTSVENAKEKLKKIKDSYGFFSLASEVNRQELVNKCVSVIWPELKDKLPKIDWVIKEITLYMWDSTISTYAQKLKNVLKEVDKALTQMIQYWEEKDVKIATNYKNQIQQRINNLKC